MNNKDKKHKKYARKAILLKYKNRRERLVLTRTVKISKHSLKIKIQCDTRSTNEGNTIITQDEKYPIFRAQLKDRIVPCCFREKCRRDIQYKSNECRRYQQGKTKYKSKSRERREKKRSISNITLSDEEYGGLQYEDISSCTDDEIEALLQSTRKRIKDSDKEWKLLPRERSLVNENVANYNNSYNRSSRSPSLNSLDTLVLEHMETKVLTAPKLNILHSPITSPDQMLDLDPMEIKNADVKLTCEPKSLKRKEYLYKTENEQSFTKKIKIEPLEVNNNDSPTYIPNFESKQSVQEQNGNFHKNEEDQTTHQQFNAAYSEVVSLQNLVKQEPLETNDNITKYFPHDLSVENKIKNEIDSVITKLERNDMDHTELNHIILTDIKQELYGDI